LKKKKNRERDTLKIFAIKKALRNLNILV
jgi:hypothetical protein